ncbi:MAG TPA: helix-turn-helix domain-containing protein [Marinobacter sp.]|uniref:helix-turn-helix domain-containing protein n=1 Tax=Marinobacter sp. TaxID=50741 RepID=UPI002D7E58F8|nr:helix-turn-helix domain-containing protein [Marinobacter sp.]HET8801878.1 helix-turn-helix domain-containing protein [Marinobacter sp.]
MVTLRETSKQWVKLVPGHAVLTTQEAADLLDTSRPTLIKLMNEGALLSYRVGNGRKILFLDLQDCKSKLEKERMDALDELNELDRRGEKHSKNENVTY